MLLSGIRYFHPTLGAIHPLSDTTFSHQTLAPYIRCYFQVGRYCRHIRPLSSLRTMQTLLFSTSYRLLCNAPQYKQSMQWNREFESCSKSLPNLSILDTPFRPFVATTNDLATSADSRTFLHCVTVDHAVQDITSK